MFLEATQFVWVLLTSIEWGSIFLYANRFVSMRSDFICTRVLLFVCVAVMGHRIHQNRHNLYPRLLATNSSIWEPAQTKHSPLHSPYISPLISNANSISRAIAKQSIGLITRGGSFHNRWRACVLPVWSVKDRFYERYCTNLINLRLSTDCECFNSLKSYNDWIHDIWIRPLKVAKAT